jgi:RimJ/RimL family protein N-acetyltransferase
MTHLTKDGDVLILAVEIQQTSRLIGDVDLTWTSVECRQGEVGVMLHPDGQGKGYAAEAVAALLRLAFEDLDLHRVVGRTDARNSAAAACMRRLGMRQEAHFHHLGIANGEWYDDPRELHQTGEKVQVASSTVGRSGLPRAQISAA